MKVWHRMVFQSVYKWTWLHKGVTALVLVAFTFTNVGTFLPWSALQDVFTVPETSAANGDFSVYRNSSNQSQVTDSPLPVVWDTVEQSSSNIDLRGDSASVDLSEGGKYLVFYNVWTEKGAGTGANRRSFETHLTLNGTALSYGRAASYFRDSGGDVAAYAAGGSIIDVPSGQDLAVNIQRDDENLAAESFIRAGTNGLSILKLNDNFDYVRIAQSSNSADISGNTTFTDVSFDTTDEADSGSFTHSGSDITLKGAAGKKFLVTKNVRLENTSGVSNRQNYETRLALDGSEVAGTRVNGYIRAEQGTDFTTLTYTGIIEKTSSADQTLTVQLRRESPTPNTTVIVGNETALSAAALPASADYVMLGSASNQSLTSIQSPFLWDEQVAVEGNSFSHSTTSNNSRVTINTAGNYLFFSTVYNDRTSSGDRIAPRIDWRLDGTINTGYGGHGSFNRGDQGADDAFTSGSSGGFLLSGVTGGQYLELLHSDETTGSPNSVFPTNRVALQGINLLSLAALDTAVSRFGTVSETIPAAESDLLLESVAVTENTSSRNVTSFVFSESGTINAETEVNNIRLYYEFDTSAPYNCVGETYSGSELQYGATSTNFTSANGTVSFSDSISISTTQALCTYLVADVDAAARDDETINASIVDPSADVVVTGGGSIGPSVTIGANTISTIADPEITMADYHWRNDDGDELSATSVTGGVENTPALAFSSSTPQRLRLNAFADGTGDATMNFRLEYAEKAGTCELASGWTDVGASGGAWNMFDSANITNGADTTNISLSSGGVSDNAPQFLSDNNALLDTTSQSGAVTVGDGELRSVGEVGTSTVTSGTPATINLANSYTNPVVNVSVRYNRNAETQRVARVTSKSASSFEVLVDNFDSSVTGSTVIDYVVVEAGEWDILNDEGEAVQMYATTTLVSQNAVAARGITTPPASSTIFTYPTSFDSQPTVLATVSSNNDPDWLFASVYDGSSISVPPSGNQLGVFLNENFESDGHTADENVDILVAKQLNGSYAGLEYRFTTSGGANVNNTPSNLTFAAMATSPAVTAVKDLTINGADGGYALVDTGTAPTMTSVSVAIDEDGTGADRGHTNEEVGAFVFSVAGQLFVDEVINNEFVELEYAIQATPSTLEGAAYCFRVSDAGTPLRNYSNYPEATLNADVAVSATGTQATTTTANTNATYVGGAFVIQDNTGTRDVTSVTLSETGSVDASSTLANVRLHYDMDTTAPYDCSSESYVGTEPQYGATSTAGFSAPNGTTTFTDTVTISTTSALCLYPVADIFDANNGETLAYAITNPSAEVMVTSGSVGPGSQIDFTSSTTIQNAEVTQTGYHWRTNNGDEAGASSATGGSENTAITNVAPGSINRLRLAVSNEGGASSLPDTYQLEYGTKVSTCEAVASWQAVSTGAAFTMASTSQLVEGGNTTNIAVADGGVTDPNTSFLTSNGGQRDTSDTTGSLSFTSSEFIELEYAIEPTNQIGFATSYCFRVSGSGGALDTYDVYGELTIQGQQDFFIQRGSETITSTSTTLVAGVDYTAPDTNSRAFIRITNTHMTGAGGTAGAQDTPDDFTAYIENPSNLDSSVTIARPSTADNDTNVSWEIIEYVGIGGADNEIIIRDTGTVTYGSNDLTVNGPAVGGIVDDDDVVVFITGQQNPDTGTDNYNTSLSVSDWDAQNNIPQFERGDADGVAASLSYAVVEFIGRNWHTQRVDHTYSAAGVTETEAITVVNSLSRTFLHTQKLNGDELYNLDETGHEVWLSSIGAISFELEAGATNPGDQRSVAWVIENTQSGNGSMSVFRSNGTVASGGAEPATFTFAIGSTINTTNASIWVNNQSTGTGSFQPRGFLGARLLNETQYELFRADSGQNQDFRTEVVEWPTAELSITQNYYRLYVPNDTVTPSDPHPLGASDIGENAAMTDLFEPLGQGEQVYIRMSLFVNNANFVENSKAFRLEFGRRVTTCDAVSTWTPIGAPGSGETWRGADATPTDGVAIGDLDLLLSVSDVGGTYEEQNDSSLNPDVVQIGEDIEYGWLIENNGGLQRTSYCFRMVEAGGAELDAYDFYPTVRTSGYTPVSTTWRWYSDIDNETPSNPSAAAETAVSGVGIDDTFKLRIAAAEVEGAAGSNIKFNLQFSEFSDFRDGGTTLAATSSCSGNSLWCYADGAADADNDVITTPVLSGIDSCAAGVGDGCGLHNEAPGLTSPFAHEAFASTEHEFTLQQDGARVNAVYYFRLIDATNGVPVTASSSYPSLQVSTSSLSFSVAGLPAGTSTANVTTDVSTSETNIAFSSLPIDTLYEAAQRLTVSTNATDGYQVYVLSDGPLRDGRGNEIAAISSTNPTPTAWATACSNLDAGCFGYHTTDADLFGTSARFAPDDSYAALTTDPAEVVYSSLPVSTVHDVIYRVQINELQPAGVYNTNISYIVAPAF